MMTYELNILNLLEQTDISREIKIVNHWMNNVVLDDLGGIRIIIRGNYAKISLVDHHNHQLFYNGELI